jgi:HEAT repeat protein
MSIFGPPNIEKLKAKRNVKGLIKALEYKKSSRVRSEAAVALGEIGNVHAITPLVNRLQAPDELEDVTRQVAEALVKFGSPAVDPLIECLFIDFPRRYLAVEALGKIGNVRALLPLIQLLKDMNRNIRYQSAIALESIGWKPSSDEEKADDYIARQDWDQCVLFGAAAVERLISILRDNDVNVRRMAANTLGKIKDVLAIEPLSLSLNDGQASVRQEAVKALMEIGGESVELPLMRALRDGDENVRSTAAEALGELGDPGAVVALINALKDHNSAVRVAAIRALGKIGDPRAVPPLIDIFYDSMGEEFVETKKVLMSLYQDGKLDDIAKSQILKHPNILSTRVHNDTSCGGTHIDY